VEGRGFSLFPDENGDDATWRYHMTAVVTKARNRAPVAKRARDREITLPTVTDLLPALLGAHLDAARSASLLDLADADLWSVADQLVAEISAEAYRIKAAIHGTPPIPTASRLSPVVRIRELAHAQRSLAAATESARPGQRIAGDVVRSTIRVGSLSRLISALVC
jgi:hypothetical protein